MTPTERMNWMALGQIVLVCTLAIMLAGAVRAQSVGVTDQMLQQAAATATATADIKALGERIGKVESQINYVLAAIVGSILAQLFQLRASGRYRHRRFDDADHSKARASNR